MSSFYVTSFLHVKFKDASFSTSAFVIEKISKMGRTDEQSKLVTQKLVIENLLVCIRGLSSGKSANLQHMHTPIRVLKI